MVHVYPIEMKVTHHCLKYLTFSIKLRYLFVNLVTLLFIYHRFGKQIVKSCWSSGVVHSFQTAVPVMSVMCLYYYYFLEDFYCYNIIIPFLRPRFLGLIS